jgi:predicted RNase H-like nuclease (RuvC/YqgF family)
MKHHTPVKSDASRQAAVLEAHAATLRDLEATIDQRDREIDALHREVEAGHRKAEKLEREIQRLKGELVRRGPINSDDELTLAKRNANLAYRITSQGKIQLTLSAPGTKPILAPSSEQALDAFFHRTPPASA